MHQLISTAAAAGVSWSWDENHLIWKVPRTTAARAAMAAIHTQHDAVLAELVALRVQAHALQPVPCKPLPPWLVADPLVAVLRGAGIDADAAQVVAERLAVAGISMGTAATVISALVSAGIFGEVQNTAPPAVATPARIEPSPRPPCIPPVVPLPIPAACTPPRCVPSPSPSVKPTVTVLSFRKTTDPAMESP